MSGFFGGPANAVKLLCRHLSQSANISVITTAAINQSQDLQKRPYYEKKDGYLTFFFPRILKFRSLNLAFYLSPSMRAAFNQYARDVDIIHLQSWRTIQDFFVYIYSRKYHVPYIVEARGDITPKGGFIKESIKMIYNYLFGYRFLKNATKVVALTQNERKLFLQLHISKDKIVIIPDGVDFNADSNLSGQKNRILNPKLKKYENLLKMDSIIFLGRIHRVKNVDLIIKAFGEVVKFFPNINLFIAGPFEDTAYCNQLKTLIKDNKIEGKVIFTGLLNESEKFQLLMRGSIFVLPSKSEGFSNAILEAMSCRLPVIISSGCNFPEVAESQAGIIIQPHLYELSTALLKLLNNPDLRKQMGENAFNLVEKKYSMNFVTEQVIKLYQKILSTR